MFNENANDTIFQPREILHGAVDEILRSLKSDNVREKEKRREVEALIGKLADDRFALLHNLSKKITDFVFDEDEDDNQEDVEETVGVRFDEEDEDEQGDMENEIREEDDEEEEGGVEADVEETLKRTIGDDDMQNTKAKKQKLHPREINAQWIARQVSSVMKIDEVEVQKKEQKILDILEHETDPRLCENKLFDILDAYEKDRFDLVKILVQNRLMVLYCTKLAKAEPTEKHAIEQQMTNDPDLSPILRKLKNVEVDDAIQESIDKKERAAAAKRSAEAGQQAMAMGSYNEPKIVKFDELAFAQGSHFNSNKTCVLPKGSTKTQKKSYESVIVPPQKPRPFDKNEVCVFKMLCFYSVFSFLGAHPHQQITEMGSKWFHWI